MKKFCLTEGVGTSKREELKIADNKIMLLSVGELTFRENHKLIIEALVILCTEVDITNIKYYICGTGNLLSELKQYVSEMKLENNIYFWGYRSDVFNFAKQQIYMFSAFARRISCGVNRSNCIEGSSDLFKD